MNAIWHRRRSIFFTLLFLSVVYGIFFVVVEGIIVLLFFITKNPNFSKIELQRRLAVVAQTAPSLNTVDDRVQGYVSGFIPHPYVGFVRDMTKEGVNSYGWTGPSPITKRESGKIVVAVFGGSVANMFFDIYRENFISELQQLPQFQMKRIEVVNISLDGYKQPQQLLALEYLLSQGAQYDIIINIDGFNEVVLPASDNFWQHVAPIFPRSWNWYAQTLLNRTMLQHVTRLYTYQDRRQFIARLFSMYPLREHRIWLVLWNILDQEVARGLFRETEILKQVARNDGEKYSQINGPKDASLTMNTILPYSVAVWKNASEQMAKISKENGMFYIHILQPNQYYQGSKVLSDEEKNKAFYNYTVSSDDPSLMLSYRWAATKGYPLLVEAGKELAKQGEYFFDFTQIFSGVTETIYVDDCCHYNTRGNELFVHAIVNAIIQTCHFAN